MGVTKEGFFDWAIKDPGPPGRVNAGKNNMDGAVLHSAEGYWPVLRAVLWGDRGSSWMASNLQDGRFIQHYPVWARTWTSGAGYPNNSFNAWENEGIEGEALTDAQNQNNIRAIRELSEMGDWIPKRPSALGDFGATLWEHKEMVRFGAEPTACPSGRIPWRLYLDALNEEDDVALETVWCPDNQRLYVVGQNVPVWIADQKVAADIQAAYGAPKKALSWPALKALGAA